jgi:hypothetical protein
MVPTTGGGAPQGLFGPAVTTPATTAASSPARGGGGGLFQANQAGAPNRGGKASERSDADKKKPEEKEEPQSLARRETGNVWGYVKPNEDPYN